MVTGQCATDKCTDVKCTVNVATSVHWSLDLSATALIHSKQRVETARRKTCHNICSNTYQERSSAVFLHLFPSFLLCFLAVVRFRARHATVLHIKMKLRDGKDMFIKCHGQLICVIYLYIHIQFVSFFFFYLSTTVRLPLADRGWSRLGKRYDSKLCFSLVQSQSCPLDGDRDVDNLQGGGWLDRHPNCIQARILNEFALLCWDAYASQGIWPFKWLINHFQLHFFTCFSTEMIDLIGANEATLASAFTSRLCLLLKEKCDGHWQCLPVSMCSDDPTVNCPGLVRRLHCLLLLCEPVTDIYRSVCKENINIYAEGEPVTTAFWYAWRRDRAHFTSA